MLSNIVNYSMTPLMIKIMNTKHVVSLVLSVLVLGVCVEPSIALAKRNRGRNRPSNAAYMTQPRPGEFDSFVLAMSYENDFCLANPKKSECQDGYDHYGMVLHGLWPNKDNDSKHAYQYCALTQKQFGRDWCALDTDVAAQMTFDEYLELLEVMPGVESCLHNHEWYAHGSCSGMEVSEYFSTSKALAKKFRELKAFPSLLVASAGQEISLSQLMDALKRDLGPKAEDSAVVMCRKNQNTKKAYFSELRISLSRSAISEFPAPASMVQAAPFVRRDGQKVKDQGNCPESEIFIAP